VPLSPSTVGRPLAAAVVADAMVTSPATHPGDTTVGRLREFFADDHVHMALLLDGRRLVAAVERRDLDAVLDERAPARGLGPLPGRTVAAGTPVWQALGSLRASGRRRLAVTNERGELLGLLCLKSTGGGFCSDADVAERRRGAGVSRGGRHRRRPARG
jgi:hypothetical protein